MSKTGTYNHISEWNNSKAAKWGPITDRFKVINVMKDNPGPGAHD